MENVTSKPIATDSTLKLALSIETGDTQTLTTNQQPIPIKKLSIIIPAYNEERTIALILDRINEVKLIRNIEKEVINVNDRSTDNTEFAVQNCISNSANISINFFKYIKRSQPEKGCGYKDTGTVLTTGEYLLKRDTGLHTTVPV